MEQTKGLWVNELPIALWAYHTTPKCLPRKWCRLVYGLDAMILVELIEPSLRTIFINEESNEATRRAQLDLI